MIDVDKALQIILSHCPPPQSQAVTLEQAFGRILRENIYADRDFPPFHRVAMDGIALRHEAFQQGRRVFAIAGQAWAGAPPPALPHPNACLEVATGAMLPEGTDTVIPYEQITLTGKEAQVASESVQPYQNVHLQGLDRRSGDLLLSPGIRISAAELATLATVGKQEVVVSRRLRIAVVATGDELVPVGTTPLPWQIRRSNPYALTALLRNEAEEIDVFHWKDDYNLVEKNAKEILTEYNVVLFSGGVSAGKKDFLPEIFQSIGVKIPFHKVAQRPGKPLLFGYTDAGATLFALPGNPVSAFLCTCKYVLPWLRKAQGDAETREESAVLTTPLTFKPDLTWFVPVSVENNNGRLLATPHPGHGSGDLANLQEADGFLELPRGRDLYECDEAFRFLRYRY